MTINLEILDSAYVYAPQEIVELRSKEFVPKMMTRRRLTRASKIAIYLANEVSFSQGRIIYGSSFGELTATANILDSIAEKTPISPTHFQNSVYNTAVSYLSMLYQNKAEIMTLSSGDETSSSLLKMGAIKALDGDTILLLLTETLNIPNIEEVNSCSEMLECGVALKIKVTEEKANINYQENLTKIAVPNSIKSLLSIAEKCQSNQANIITVKL